MRFHNEPAAAPALPDRWIFGGLLLLLLWLPLPWGSHTVLTSHIANLAALALLSLWLLLAAAGKVHGPRHRGDLMWPVLFWALWLGWIALQCAPLPMDTVAAVSPRAAEAATTAAAITGLTADARLSIAPALSLLELELSLGYFALYLLVLFTVRNESRARAVLFTLVLSGAFQAAYGSAMVLSDAELGGLFQPKRSYLGNATGTFINRNHLAGYLELTAAMGLALILADLGRGGLSGSISRRLRGFVELFFSTKFRVRVLLVVIAIGLVLTRSRMGNVAFFSSLAVTGLLFVFFKERRHFWKAVLLFASIVVIDIAVVSNWYGLQKVAERLEATGEGDQSTQIRLIFNNEAHRAIEPYWLTGSGLGTFAPAYEALKTPDMRWYFDFAHNDYAQFLIETGVIGITLLGLLVGIHLTHCLRVLMARRQRLPVAIAAGTLMALAALALHTTVDFNLQIPANAATLCVILGLAASVSTRSKRQRTRRRSQSESESQADDVNATGISPASVQESTP